MGISSLLRAVVALSYYSTVAPYVGIASGRSVNQLELTVPGEVAKLTRNDRTCLISTKNGESSEASLRAAYVKHHIDF